MPLIWIYRDSPDDNDVQLVCEGCLFAQSAAVRLQSNRFARKSAGMLENQRPATVKTVDENLLTTTALCNLIHGFIHPDESMTDIQ